MKQLSIPTNKGTKTVWEQNIIRIEASSNYCKIYFSNERPLVVAKVLHWFQDVLTQDDFCRIHRTHIVNRMYVTEIVERTVLKLSNGDQVQISRRRKNYMDQLLKQRA